jgi:regulatory protein YycH of two-component signal transduction system YycFG
MSPISRKDWDRQIAEAIKKVNKNLEMHTIFTKNPEKQQTLRKLIGLIGPDEMNSIIFAELIDSTNPVLNEAFFNTILENAGPEFLGLFPAL